MSAPEKIRLYCDVHCWLGGDPDGTLKPLEWRVCVVGGPLLLVTKNEALARMIAAAPEMLVALEVVRDARKGETWTTLDSLDALMTQIESMAEDAIAKTEERTA